jgi:chloramphenicol-sensitive protein RarD
LPWIGLVLGLSFGAYGLLRKVASLGALEGLTLETIILAPAAIVGMAIWWRSTATSFPGPDATTNAWLIGLGPATTLPLLLFAVAARRLTMTTLGLFQYLSPTIQFLLGVWLFREPFGSARFAGFVLIWIALALYSLDGWRRRTTRVVAAEG